MWITRRPVNARKIIGKLRSINYCLEMVVLVQIKKNKKAKAKISKKISHIIMEKSKLLRIMEEKAVSMKKFNIGAKL